MIRKSIISKQEKERLYRNVKYDLGYPTRPINLTDEQMDAYLEMALEDYSSYVNEWLIQQQWINLNGSNVTSTDFLLAYSTQSNEFMKKFTYAYSRQVGLGSNAPAGNSWHLKKDFIIVSADTQVYSIPAGREINEVLWSTPPNIDGGMVDPFAATNWAHSGLGWSYMGHPAQYVQPTYSLLLAAQDRDLKRRILQSELTYRVTGGPNGTKLLYLYPIPGSREEIAGRFGRHLEGTKVWYFYYDIASDERDKCLEENDDTIKLPSDVPVNALVWDDLNSMARTDVRDLLISRCKIVIGGIRGFFSGVVGPAEAQQTMDYRHLLEEGEKLRDRTIEKITNTLNKISLVQLTEDRAKIAENVMRERQLQPFISPVIVK